MVVNTIPFKLRGKSTDISSEKKDAPQERWLRKFTLKEMQAKQYPFLNSDVSRIFDDLLNANLIELPEMKWPEEVGKTDDPKYCKYHRLVGHPIHDCFIFKDKVMQLARQGNISLEEDNAASNLITITFGSFDVMTELGDKASCNMTQEEETLIGEDYFSNMGIPNEESMSAMTFTDEDLLLGSKPHNRLLFRNLLCM
ncbi:UNVERIFIED_CONTAM: hypothetical protein Sangu_1445200 [Sesamum angustifolium]|uniref:Uncharacterized protein n=1 Tax=Sesamum angustifolium TaxID=2727405 RepID=A0AAW2N9Z1_9LAMI